jgi:hypothetical protein
MTELPIFDGIRGTCKRWGFSRGYFHAKVRPHVETRALERKILVRQIGPRSVEELIGALPEPGSPQAPNLVRGTDLSHERSIRRKRRLRPARERGRRA